MTIEIAQPGGAQRRFVPFASGFRPMFLLAGAQAVAAMAGWLVFYFGSGALPQAFFPVVWHGHEMVYGFAAAAVAGFLLTAVPNWTGTRPVSGPPLVALTLVWIVGRLAFWLSQDIPALLVAALDLAFVPLLLALVGKPLWAAGPRNRPFLALLAAFWVGAAMVHGEALGLGDTAATGVRVGIWVLLTLIAIVGGRIVPAFTGNWMRQNGVDGQIRVRPWLEKVAPAGVAAAGLADVVSPTSPATAMLLILVAALHAIRLAGWQGARTMGAPIVWVLHVAYSWLVVGLALRGVAVLWPLVVPPSAGLHALTVGAVGLMVMGVMTRAALGHSGRPLRVPTVIAWAYGLLALAAFIRAIGPIVHSSAAGDLIPAVTGGLWTLAWAIYVAVYAPICLRPRIDGRPG